MECFVFVPMIEGSLIIPMRIMNSMHPASCRSSNVVIVHDSTDLIQEMFVALVNNVLKHSCGKNSKRICLPSDGTATQGPTDEQKGLVKIGVKFIFPHQSFWAVRKGCNKYLQLHRGLLVVIILVVDLFITLCMRSADLYAYVSVCEVHINLHETLEKAEPSGNKGKTRS